VPGDDGLPARRHAADRLEGLGAVVADPERPVRRDDEAVAGAEVVRLAVEVDAGAPAQRDEGLVARQVMPGLLRRTGGERETN